MRHKALLLTPLFVILLTLVPRPSAAFHTVITPCNPRQGCDWLCFQQPIQLGVNAPETTTSLEANAHIGWIRFTLRWSNVEPSANVWNFGQYDNFVNTASAQGYKLLAILSTAPQWAGGGSNGTIPPSNIALWQAFVQMTAQRYRGKIAAYEIWNEPNLDGTCCGIGVGWNHPLNSPPLYVDYLHAAAVQIRTYAPGTLVVAPALSSQPDSNGTTIFNQIETTNYPDGPGYSFMDVVSFHANGNENGKDQSSADIASWITGHLNQIDGFNRSKPIWLTEFGWPSNSAGESGQEVKIFNVNEYISGDFTPGAFDCLSYQWYKFTHAFIFELQDDASTSRGIFRIDGSPKPTVTQYTATLPFPATHPSVNHSPMSVSCSGRTCTFTNPWTQSQSSTQYGWDFGDGSVAYSVGGRVMTHTYAAGGTYFVFTGANLSNGSFGDQSDVKMVTVQ